MRDYLTQLFIIFCLLSLAGCQQSKIQELNSFQLSQLTDEDIIEINQTACQRQDQYEVPVSETHPLQLKINQLVYSFPTVINGKTLNYRVYLNTVPLAWSSLNGCIRINSGLMKILNDNEIQAVIAHEIGHIALNHSISKIHQAKSAEIKNNGEMTFINTQALMQQQELAADSYALEFLKQHNIETNGLILMLDKLNHHQKQKNSSHPDTTERKMNLSNKIK